MKRGFLLMNTGSPDSTTVADLRTYLKEFLMDPFVVDLPWPLRALLVYGLILPRRPAASAEAYKQIWTEKGSPLIHYCTELAAGLETEICMAYGNPSVPDAIERLLADGVDEVCLLPMFPHYAMATTGSCIAGVTSAIQGRAALRVAPPFFQEPTFITPLAGLLAGVDEHVLFTYHGLPERHLKKDAQTADYQINCIETSRLIAEEAGIAPEDYSISFQSRLGRDKWLEPFTEETLRQLPAAGHKRLAVICPSFFCDCLETLEEIEIRGRKFFLEAGGETFRMIPCLNNSPAGFHCLKTLMGQADAWPSA